MTYGITFSWLWPDGGLGLEWNVTNPDQRGVILLLGPVGIHFGGRKT